MHVWKLEEEITQIRPNLDFEILVGGTPPISKHLKVRYEC